MREGQKTWIASVVGSFVNLQSELDFQPPLSSYLSPSSPCISIFFRGIPRRLPYDKLYFTHEEDTAYFSHTFSPPPPHRFARKDKREEGEGQTLREQHAA